MKETYTPAEVQRGRLLIVVAAVLWSTSGAFTKILTRPTPLDLDQPLEGFAWSGHVFPVQIAFYRALFASLMFGLFLRPRDVQFGSRFTFGLLLLMGACFACMNITFVSAQALGTAANAILLQYSAPLWMVLASITLLGEPSDRRNTIMLAFGMLGIGIIVASGWTEGDVSVMAIGLLSGFFYACVVLCLRSLRALPSHWLTFWNHAVSALVLVPVVIGLAPPSFGQLGLLFLFGVVQMSAAYWLMARGLRTVSPQEAGAITLLEPLLNPLWTYLISGETPETATFVGGGVILAALAWRYWPRASTP